MPLYRLHSLGRRLAPDLRNARYNVSYYYKDSLAVNDYVFEGDDYLEAYTFLWSWLKNIMQVQISVIYMTLWKWYRIDIL